MTAKELIERLQTMPPDAVVAIRVDNEFLEVVMNVKLRDTIGNVYVRKFAEASDLEAYLTVVLS